MSLEEQIAATEDTVVALKERREAKALAPHNVPLHSFHDMRANIESVEKEVFFFPISESFVANSHIIPSLAGGLACPYWNRNVTHCCPVLFRSFQPAVLF
jgi:hypothetical protein